MNETIIVDAGQIVSGIVGGSLVVALMALGFVLALIATFVYIYHTLAWMSIANKLKYKRSWLAWIPFAATAMKLQLGKKFHWAWVFLFLIPVVGWIALLILVIVSHWKIFEELNYPGWLSLALIVDIIPGISGLGIILYLISIGFVAWRVRGKKVSKKSKKK